MAFICIGANNTGCVTSDGRGYVWGSATMGQIGNEEHHPAFEV